MGKLNISEIDKTFESATISVKEQQMNKLKHFMHKLVRNTQRRQFEFNITEGTYIPNDEVSQALELNVPIIKPLSGKAVIYFSEDGNTEENDKKIVCMTLTELQELLKLYEEAIDLKVE